MLTQLQKDLRKLANPEKAKILSRFFKTGKGEYGEGDIFLGITVPEQRRIAIRFKTLDLSDIQKLLKSKVHEERLTALLILVEQYKKSDEKKKKNIVNFYLQNTKNINNWDLVDLSAEKILGNYLLNKDTIIIYKLVKSDNIWERRIGVMATFQFIKNKNYNPTLRVVNLLIGDKRDLIQKACGWMLREIGKRNQKVEEEFLKKYYKIMPRTMLRYAIEKFSEDKRKYYLKKQFN